jgi:hypothetical protein
MNAGNRRFRPKRLLPLTGSRLSNLNSPDLRGFSRKSGGVMS